MRGGTAPRMADDLVKTPMSPGLQATLIRARDYAIGQSHAEVTLEHLLLALTEDEDAAGVMQSSEVDLGRVRNDVAGYLGGLSDRGPPGTPGSPAISAPLTEILKYATLAAKQGRRARIDGAIVLAALVGDGRSMAASFLNAQGLTFEAAIRVLQRSAAPALAPATPRPQLEAPPPHIPGHGAVPAMINPGAAGPSPAVSHATEDILAAARERINSRTAQLPRLDPLPTEPPATFAPSVGSDTPSPYRPAMVDAVPAPPAPEFAPSPHSAASLDAPSQGRLSPPVLPPDLAPVPQPIAAPPLPPAEPVLSSSEPGGPPSKEPWPALEPPPPADGHRPRSGELHAPGPTPVSLELTLEQRMPPPPMAPPPRQSPTTWTPPPLPSPGGFAHRPPTAPAPQYRPPPGPANQPPHRPQGAEPSGAPPWVDAPRPGQHHQPLHERLVPRPSTLPPPVPSGHGDVGAHPGHAIASPQRDVPAPRVPATEATKVSHNIPARLHLGRPVHVEVHVSRPPVVGLAAGPRPTATAAEHVAARAISVRLRPTKPGLVVEALTPETQWDQAVGPTGRLTGDAAIWRFALTSLQAGQINLQLVVTTRTVGADGVIADASQPDQQIILIARRDWMQMLRRAVKVVAIVLATLLLSETARAFLRMDLSRLVKAMFGSGG